VSALLTADERKPKRACARCGRAVRPGQRYTVTFPHGRSGRAVRTVLHWVAGECDE
jgi:hypothetical protein